MACPTFSVLILKYETFLLVPPKWVSVADRRPAPVNGRLVLQAFLLFSHVCAMPTLSVPTGGVPMVHALPNAQYVRSIQYVQDVRKYETVR